MPDTVFNDHLVKPLVRFVYALAAVAVVYGCCLAHTQYIVHQNNLGEAAQLRAQNQQMAAWIQNAQAQAKQRATAP
jgi:hypothetical protein